ncbi:MAG: Cof-type HAD-IIB family hydrolase [Clostridia bacterium]|nr:Cof-type HAD-IIB family hydrolase [Clostridia bacterium]
MYKLIAIDLDGTLLNSYGKISNKNKNAIKKAKENGTQVIIASGRHITSVKSFAKEISSENYSICGNGAILYDMKNDKILYNKFIDKEKILEIIEVCEQNSIYYNIYTETEILTRTIEYSALFYKQENEKKDSKYQTNIRVVGDLYNFVKNNNSNNYIKVTIYDDNLLIFNRIIQKLREIDNIDVLDVGHMSRKMIKVNNEDVEIKYYYTEITKNDVNKWNAIKVLMNKLNIKASEVIAIGDNVNDKEMLENAGLGVVMGNSAEYVKKFGNVVVNDNNSDGVAQAIEKYVTQNN